MGEASTPYSLNPRSIKTCEIGTPVPHPRSRTVPPPSNVWDQPATTDAPTPELFLPRPVMNTDAEARSGTRLARESTHSAHLRASQRPSREHFDQDGGNRLGRSGYLADPTEQALAVNSADLIEDDMAVLALEGE